METENQKMRERVEELSRETMLLAHTVTDLTAKLKLATSQAIGFIGAHAPGYYDTERNKPLPMESRRHYDGDGTAGDWMPIDAAEYERRKNDASFEFRQAAEVTHLAEKLAGRDASLAGLMKPVSKTTLADFGGDQANYDAWKKFQASAAPQPVDAAQAVPELPTKLINGMEWPEGYVTDPNGVIVPPQGRVNDYNFGYNQGYGDGLLAIKDSVAAIVARTVPDGYVVVPRVPTLDMYNAACKAFCAWEVMCADEARDGQDFTQPNFTHSDAYVAMLAAAPQVAQASQPTSAGEFPGVNIDRAHGIMAGYNPKPPPPRPQRPPGPLWTDAERERFRENMKRGERCPICSVIEGGQHFPGCSRGVP